MKIHRFYVGGSNLNMRQDFWVHDKDLVLQLNKVLRLKVGEKIALFDVKDDKLYEIIEINDREVHLTHITDIDRRLPDKEIYLAWSMLKSDKNDWVVQKATELGVKSFIPLLADRCDRTDISLSRIERLKKISIEASEQCGRSDIPHIREEPIKLSTLIEEFSNKSKIIICEQHSGKQFNLEDSDLPCVLIVGPEGGWSDNEKQLFLDKNFEHLSLGKFTLRAETASVVAVSKLLQ